MPARVDSGGDDGFLTRWSRRKRGALAETPEAAPQPAERSAPAGEIVPAEAAPQAEMVEPPSLDLVDKDFDVAHWLKQNVPESWKLAALRRAWESDPAIAGYENPARDYALDWNTPGGAPGYGPLSESDDVAEMVRKIFGEPPQPGPAESLPPEPCGDPMSHQIANYDESRSGDAAPQQLASAAADQNPVRLTDKASDGSSTTENPAVSPERVNAAAQNNAPSNGAAVRLRKRGGGATPV